MTHYTITFYNKKTKEKQTEKVEVMTFPEAAREAYTKLRIRFAEPAICSCEWEINSIAKTGK